VIGGVGTIAMAKEVKRIRQMPASLKWYLFGAWPLTMVLYGMTYCSNFYREYVGREGIFGLETQDFRQAWRAIRRKMAAEVEEESG
jgi:hypothetical protein